MARSASARCYLHSYLGFGRVRFEITINYGYALITLNFYVISSTLTKADMLYRGTFST